LPKRLVRVEQQEHSRAIKIFAIAAMQLKQNLINQGRGGWVRGNGDARREGPKWQVTSVARQLPQANSYTRRKKR